MLIASQSQLNQPAPSRKSLLDDIEMQGRISETIKTSVIRYKAEDSQFRVPTFVPCSVPHDAPELVRLALANLGVTIDPSDGQLKIVFPATLYNIETKLIIWRGGMSGRMKTQAHVSAKKGQPAFDYVAPNSLFRVEDENLFSLPVPKSEPTVENLIWLWGTVPGERLNVDKTAKEKTEYLEQFIIRADEFVSKRMLRCIEGRDMGLIDLADYGISFKDESNKDQGASQNEDYNIDLGEYFGS